MSIKKQGMVLWLFGLSGSGKSTLAKRLDEMLTTKGHFVKRLDGDALRAGINSDLGFSAEDRQENIRRAAEIAKLFSDAGIVTICSFISPANKLRETARQIIGTAFHDVFLDCPIETCVSRDPKGLYKKALSGEIKDFTGIGASFERPDKCFYRVDTDQQGVQETASMILDQVMPLLMPQPKAVLTNY
jgi:adenylylsulfate kinase